MRKLLRLYEAKTARIWAEKGVSPFRANNLFGSQSTLFKNIN